MTGIKVALQSADTLKRLPFELGGKSPLLVFADLDMESAVRVWQWKGRTHGVVGLIHSNGSWPRLFRNEWPSVHQWHTCLPCVERSIRDEFVDRVLRQRNSSVTIGDHMLEEVTMGPRMMPPRNRSRSFDRVMGFSSWSKKHSDGKVLSVWWQWIPKRRGLLCGINYSIM
jgi:hypothetical protein